MGLIYDAICWDQTYASIILYGLFEGPHVPTKLEFSAAEAFPLRVLGPFELTDEGGVIGQQSLFRYSIRLAKFPAPLQPYLSECFSEVLGAEATCAWFAFEGGFDFDTFLTEENANQIYGFCIPGLSPRFATDEEIETLDWSRGVAEFREYALNEKRSSG